MTKEDDKLLSLTEAATIANYNPASLRKAVLSGRLPAKKIGNQWTITQDDLSKWMNSEDYHTRRGRPNKRD
jgi:hypothetical protein